MQLLSDPNARMHLLPNLSSASILHSVLARKMLSNRSYMGGVMELSKEITLGKEFQVNGDMP